MANIKPYTDEIQNAVYGEEVRSSIINALNKVNDDNESYQAIKQQIVKAQDDVNDAVAQFDAKVASARDATTALVNATATANSAREQLESKTVSANTARTNLVSATTDANNVKGQVDTSTRNAQTAKANADTAKSALDTSISNANTAKSNLDKAISDANTAKSNLNTATSTGNTTKQNLDTAISNAQSAKTALETVISNAGTAQSNLSGVITQANTALQNLQNATGTANDIFSHLQSENVNAKANLDALRSEDFNAKEILAGVTDIKAYLGMIETDNVLGITMDYKNKTCTRIAGAKNLNAGADFDRFSMFGGRRRCNVADDGTIVAYYGDADYKEDGSMGQVMVYQPKFYYMVAPLEYDAQSTGYGYHLRKANYYITDKARAGFKVHPAFIDKNGNECDYILMSAFEGCIYDASASAYLKNDEQVADFNNDKFASIADARPASGLSQNLARPNVEKLAQNRGADWHSLGIKTVSMEQLLMIIEMGMMNLQTAIGQGVVSIPDNSSMSCASFTGSTVGNGTGEATSSKDYAGTVQTASGKKSICYRGVENFWGNIWKFACGVNIWGNGQMQGGQPFICSDFNYAESKNSDNYEGAGFCMTNANGYISAMGYSTKYDWLFMASETLGNSSLPVGDYTYVTPDLNEYRIARLGGYWYGGANAGGFYWSVGSGVGNRDRGIGGRLVYVPTVTV